MRDRSGALTSLVVAAAAAGAGWKWQTTSYEAANVPIYAYGVMLGLSLVIGLIPAAGGWPFRCLQRSEGPHQAGTTPYQQVTAIPVAQGGDIADGVLGRQQRRIVPRQVVLGQGS